MNSSLGFAWVSPGLRILRTDSDLCYFLVNINIKNEKYYAVMP